MSSTGHSTATDVDALSSASTTSSKSSVSALTLNRQNWFKIASLIVDFGARVLRHLWKAEWQTVMQQQWEDAIDGPAVYKKEYKNIFVMRELHGNQSTMIKTGHVDEWDITLLCSMLLNSGTLNFHTRRSTEPRINSIYEFVRALRNERNTMYGHCSSTELRPGEYQYYLKTIVGLFTSVGVSERDCMAAIGDIKFESPECVSALLSKEQQYKDVMYKFRDRSFRLLTWIKDHCWSPTEVGLLELGYVSPNWATVVAEGLPGIIPAAVEHNLEISQHQDFGFCVPEITLAILPEGIMVPTFRATAGTSKLLAIGNRSLMENRDDVNLSVSTGRTWFIGLDNRFLGLVDVFIAYNYKNCCWQVLSDENSQCTVKIYDETGTEANAQIMSAGTNASVSIRKDCKLLFGRQNATKADKYLSTIEVIHCITNCRADQVSEAGKALRKNWSVTMRADKPSAPPLTPTSFRRQVGAHRGNDSDDDNAAASDNASGGCGCLANGRDATAASILPSPSTTTSTPMAGVLDAAEDSTYADDAIPSHNGDRSRKANSPQRRRSRSRSSSPSQWPNVDSSAAASDPPTPSPH